MKLKKIKENTIKIMYKIDQDVVELDDKKFKVKRCTSNLSSYLNKNSSSLLEYLNLFVNNNCIHCGEEINNNRFERNIFHTYKFCKACIKDRKHKLYKEYKCSMCGKVVLKKDMVQGTCGDDVCLSLYKEYKNNRIKETHWIKGEDAQKIINKKVKTRIDNDKLFNRKYVAWNKGKTNIYSKETIEKIRKGVINHVKTGRIRKTKIEEKLDDFFSSEKLNYKYSFILKDRQYDFLLKDYNIIIEADGDFWHGNPKFYDDDDINKKNLYDYQKMKKIDDKVKNSIALSNGYQILRFWEDDINNNFDNVKEIIKNKLIYGKSNIQNSKN